RAEVEDGGIGANHPDGGRGFHDAAASCEPELREFVISGKAGELVPVIVNRIDMRVVGPFQIAGKLKVVRWVGKNEINRLRRQLRYPGDAVADKNAVRLGIL